LTADSDTKELETPYVFIDTQAFRRAHFDWCGVTLSKLVELVKDGHIVLVTTRITKREVVAQLQEMLLEARAALVKHSSILSQLSASDAVAKANDDRASMALQSKFEEFLVAARANEIPTISDVAPILDDYFDRKPPFSKKKKSEFPDAIVAASLTAWAQKVSARIYIVSNDPDMKACCENNAAFIHSESISEIISKATVSKAAYDALVKAIEESPSVSEEISEQLKESNVTVPRRFRYIGSRRADISGHVRAISDINIFSTNVLEREGNNFNCEIEFGADIELRLRVEIEGEYGYCDDDDYEPPEEYDLNRTVHRTFGAAVVVDFDPDGGDPQIASVCVYDTDVEIETDNLIDLYDLRWR
jgi:hypothetical protein